VRRVDPSEDDARDPGRDLRADQRGVERGTVLEELGCDGRPGRIVVGAVQLDAVQAGPGARCHEGTETDEAVSEDDRQMRDVVPEPPGVPARRQDEVAEQDRDVDRIGGCPRRFLGGPRCDELDRRLIRE
jgi:hypothetical protein